MREPGWKNISFSGQWNDSWSAVASSFALPLRLDSGFIGKSERAEKTADGDDVCGMVSESAGVVPTKTAGAHAICIVEIR